MKVTRARGSPRDEINWVIWAIVVSKVSLHHFQLLLGHGDLEFARGVGARCRVAYHLDREFTQ